MEKCGQEQGGKEAGERGAMLCHAMATRQRDGDKTLQKQR